MNRLILFALLLASISVIAQKGECKKLKNGKFKIVDQDLGVDFFIERKGPKQVEYSDAIKARMIFEVKWISDCTYTLVLDKIINNEANIEYPDGLIITVEVLEVKKDSYLQRTSSNMHDLIQEKEVFKVR